MRAGWAAHDITVGVRESARGMMREFVRGNCRRSGAVGSGCAVGACHPHRAGVLARQCVVSANARARQYERVLAVVSKRDRLCSGRQPQIRQRARARSQRQASRSGLIAVDNHCLPPVSERANLRKRRWTCASDILDRVVDNISTRVMVISSSQRAAHSASEWLMLWDSSRLSVSE